MPCILVLLLQHSTSGYQFLEYESVGHAVIQTNPQILVA